MTPSPATPSELHAEQNGEDGATLDSAVIAELRRSIPQDVRQSIPVNPAQIVATAAQPAAAAGQPGTEILPGYTIVRPIGAGGFGEVFLCNAPGDFQKAVKIVFGTLDETRAERELKSLERIKSVRHPFLVSLERVEIVNGQLVIVSELADRSLKERYIECKKERKKGIPRDEVIGYVKDAAEALDYLYEKHSLQHLDVKPENLLLLGDHIKVGDFGLLKDLRDTEVSLVGGVTPLYSPPEVLDGRPTQFSDQYSLAIVYQEMLTGELPFNGRTAGQLASQHMHSAPSLKALPPSDRYAVGRALSKSPARRFKSCRDFVDAILNPPKTAVVVNEPTATNDAISAHALSASVANSPIFQAEPQKTAALPPIEQLADGTAPTVVIGVGAVGSEVVSSVRRRLNHQFGGGTRIPSVQLLAIDSDRDAVSSLGRRETAALSAEEALCVPLRAAQDYRDRRKSLQTWLSRRWLYNIPRTQQTEGIRPLGRLALVDHAATVKQRIAIAIANASSAENAAVSSVATRSQFQQKPPRVFVVGSVNGGMSSGTLPDIGYLAQSCLRDVSDDGKVIGVLLHGSSANVEKRDLTDVNTLASFCELYHLTRDNHHYPSDGTFSGGQTGQPPFQSTYTVHLGKDMTDRTIDEAIDRVSAYVVGSTFGKSAKFFDGVREIADQGESTVRSIGVYSLPIEGPEIGGPLPLCDAVLAKWIDVCKTHLVYGGDADRDKASRPEFAAPARDLVESFKLRELCDSFSEIPKDHAAALEQMVNRAWLRSAASSDRVREFNRILESSLADEGGVLRREIQQQTAAAASAHRETRLKAMRELIFSPPVEGVARLVDSIGMMFELVGQLVDIQDAAGQHRLRLEEQLRVPLAPNLTAKQLKAEICPITVLEQGAQYCNAKVSLAPFDAVASEIQFLISEVIGTSQFFDRICTALEKMRETLGHASENYQESDTEILDRLEDRIHADVLSRAGQFWPMTLTDPAHHASFVRAMTQAASSLIEQIAAQRSQEAEARIAAGGVDPIRLARPMFPSQPGAVRWLLTGPSPTAIEPIAARIEKQFGVRPTIAPSHDGTIVLYCEAENLPLANVVIGAIGERPDLVEAASRVRSRHDIDWCC